MSSRNSPPGSSSRVVAPRRNPVRGKGSNQHADKPPQTPRTPVGDDTVPTGVVAADPLGGFDDDGGMLGRQMSQARTAADAAARAAGIDPDRVSVAVEVGDDGTHTAVVRLPIPAAQPDEEPAAGQPRTVAAPDTMRGIWTDLSHDPQARTMTVGTPDGVRVTYGDVTTDDFDQLTTAADSAHSRSAVNRTAEPFLRGRPVTAVEFDGDRATVKGGSSAIDALAYRADHGDLIVKWHQSGDGPETAYWYSGVSREQFGRIAAAPSRGREMSRWRKNDNQRGIKGHKVGDTWEWDT